MAGKSFHLLTKKNTLEKEMPDVSSLKLRIGNVSNSFAKLAKLIKAVKSTYYSDKNIGKRYKSIDSLEGFLSLNSDSMPASGDGLLKAVDLGCGAEPQNIFSAADISGVDIRADVGKNVIKVNLINDSMPFPDSSLNICTAINFIEHVPRLVVLEGGIRFPFVDLMNEIHRVLCDGGLFMSYTPAYPSKEAFQDPTHVNIITEDTFPKYFCAQDSDRPWAEIYGFTGKFRLIDQAWLHNSFLLTLVKAVK